MEEAYYVSDRDRKSDGETIKTEASSGFDDKGKSILNKYVGMMKDEVDEDLKELTGPTAPDFEQTLVSDSSPLSWIILIFHLEGKMT